MKNKMKMLLKNESGVTALETAIILIAFVVVAAVFAFTILSAGTYSTEQSREAIYAGLEEVQGSVEIRGSVIGYGLTATQRITHVVFTVANVAGGNAVDFRTTNAVVVVEYRDANNRAEISTWTKTALGYDDGDDLLEERELFEITVPISPTVLGINTQFVVEVKPPSGSPLYIERTTPANIDPINDLH
jgi:flagellin FlaB